MQHETATEEERIAQDYLGKDSDVIDPSVITLNATTAAAATNLFLLSTVGLGRPGLGRHRIHTPADGEWLTLQPQRADSCPWCSLASHSQFARGDAASLPVRLRTQPSQTITSGCSNGVGGAYARVARRNLGSLLSSGPNRAARHAGPNSGSKISENHGNWAQLIAPDCWPNAPSDPDPCAWTPVVAGPNPVRLMGLQPEGP